MLLSLVSVCLLVGGCESQPPEHLQINGGQVCLDPTAVSQFAGGSLRFEVVMDSCPSMCITDIESLCSVTLEGNTIVVNSEAQWTGYDGSCTLLCATPIKATCRLDLDEGTYELRHGTDLWTLGLPSELAEACR